MKVTREMVAKKAGVCKQTVSCYLNKTRYVSKEVAQRIENAIKEYNYVPNMVARGLSKQQTMSIAVICDNLSNPNYSEIISGIEKAANKKDYSILIFDVRNNVDSIINQILARRVDGVIILTFMDKIGNNNLKKLEDNNVKLIITHSGGHINEKYMQLEPDFATGIEETILKLKDYGHKDIVMLSCFPLDVIIDKRLSIFIEIYEKYFKRNAVYVTGEKPYEATLKSGSLLAAKMFDNKISATAIITTNDLMAIGAIKELTNRKIINNISVVGFDNTSYNEYVTPAIASIGYDKINYGEKLFNKFLSNNGSEQLTEFMNTRLYIRESLKRI
jgi:DNA-binding LacI/PurR family transcriptional regulator